MELPALDLDQHAFADADGMAAAILRDGFAYFPTLLDAAEVAGARVHIDALRPNPRANDRQGMRRDGSAHDLSSGTPQAYEAHIKNIFNQDAYFLKFLDRAPVADVADAVLGDDCHIIGQTAWVNGPGREDQNLHVDYQPIELPEDVTTDTRVRIPVFVATCHYYLTDITAELAPTIFVPGSHRSGRPPHPGETEWNGLGPHQVICKAGDAVFFRSDVWHRGSANKSDQLRYLLQLHYGRRMVAQKFPPYLDFQFNPETLAHASDRQRRYLGEHQFANYD